MYKCAKCSELLNELPKGVVRCPVCSFKVLFRTRDPVTKEVRAR